jgi:hypothetical protein
MLRAMQLRRLPLVIFKSQVVAGVAVATLVSGCAYGNVRQVLRAQFASDLDCSDVTIKKRDFWYVSDNPHQYKISGCGVMRTYTCTKDDAEGLISYDEPACKWEEGDADAPKFKARPADEPMDESMEYEGDSMEAPADAPADDMEAPADDAESDLDADADLDAEGSAPKGKVKAKAKGGLRLGSD